MEYSVLTYNGPRLRGATKCSDAILSPLNYKPPQPPLHLDILWMNVTKKGRWQSCNLTLKKNLLYCVQTQLWLVGTWGLSDLRSDSPFLTLYAHSISQVKKRSWLSPSRSPTHRRTDGHNPGLFPFKSEKLVCCSPSRKTPKRFLLNTRHRSYISGSLCSLIPI